MLEYAKVNSEKLEVKLTHNVSREQLNAELEFHNSMKANHEARILELNGMISLLDKN